MPTPKPSNLVGFGSLACVKTEKKLHNTHTNTQKQTNNSSRNTKKQPSRISKVFDSGGQAIFDLRIRVTQPRSQSSSVISDVTSPVKLVGAKDAWQIEY